MKILNYRSLSIVVANEHTFSQTPSPFNYLRHVIHVEVWTSMLGQLYYT